MRSAEMWPLVLAAWLIIGPPWNGYDGAEEHAPIARWDALAGAPNARLKGSRREPFASEAQCLRYLKKQIKDAKNAAVDLWCEHKVDCPRCIDGDEFRRLQATEQPQPTRRPAQK